MLAVQLLALAAILVSVAVLTANLRLLVPVRAYPCPSRTPRVSVLVPARDEERSVERCLRSLLAQDYPDFEVVALDDGSEDATLAIMRRVEKEDGRLRVLRGEPLPPGWLGKPWACRQLANAANGEFLLFTDADTRHAPGAIACGVAAALAQDADLLSPMPHVETCTWSERLVLPTIPWGTATAIPLDLAYRLRAPWFSTADGQYLLLKADSYEAIGGHGCVRAEVVEDVALARRVKAAGLRWRMADATREVSTRMYRDLREVFEGLGKNLFGIFGYGVLRYVLAWPAIVVVYLLPTAVLLGAATGTPLPGASVAVAAATWLLTTAQFAVAYRRFGYPPALALLHPVTMALISLIAAWSLALAVMGEASWKGRTLPKRRLRWI